MPKNERRHYPILPVRFPINMTVKHGGNTFKYRLNKGEHVKCRFCGKDIELATTTVFRYRHPHDNNAKVQCLNCERIADAVYYVQKRNRIEIKAWDSGLVKTPMGV